MVECITTTKTFSLGIRDIFAEWYIVDGKWRRLTPGVRDSDWYCEEYGWANADTSDLLGNMLQYLPGVKEWHHYGGVHITFDMDAVCEAGWDQAILMRRLQAIADKFNKSNVVGALGDPFRYESTYAYGSKITRTQYPALDRLCGLLDVDYPQPISI